MANHSNEPQWCLLGQKSLSPYTINVLGGGLYIASSVVLVKQQTAMKPSLTGHDATISSVNAKMNPVGN
ncbi:hypothetical protein KIN20_010096 [Parelaphostrongylus tenuis]|uniref:Uncharacterized protein n=1 Tax=Parelaphostrongylus tenuis TaxID=148309 RepID=A0AAD5M7D2_PARTN|nr:hypothetical protein KIN20_010096 [Parelaphostrongylus tenuis]